MSERLNIEFAALDSTPNDTCIALAGEGVKLGSKISELDSKSSNSVTKGAKAASFTGKLKSKLDILAPSRISIDRLTVMGYGNYSEMTEIKAVELGGAIAALLQSYNVSTASLIVDSTNSKEMPTEQFAALLAQGAYLRCYEFTKYQTRKNKDNGDKTKLTSIVIHVPKKEKAEKAFEPLKAVANGVMFARDLVNEPANILGPVELAEQARTLEEFGVEVEILDVEQMEELGMHSLLSVGQGSVRPSRMAVMVWNGAKSKRTKPICFVGKGVVFDTGGISIKPGGGMEDMKGDMGGSAAVLGAMRALAERKAAVKAVGLIGCVENMPSGSAFRPGDIINSMSGQTIEVLNTDAEGRLVLADVLWYAQETFKPKAVIDLATLTGAIMIALGKEFAGMFSSDDKLADQLSKAAEQTGEKVWRMPIDKAYDKAIDSKNADMKNLGGRWGGSCTAAAFLHRFIQEGTPWCHLDVAGTAMGSAQTDFNQSWGSGWGVRLLDRFIADNHERSEK